MRVARYFGPASSAAKEQWVAALRAAVAEHSPFSVTVIVRSASLRSDIQLSLTGVFPRILTLSEWLKDLTGKSPLPISQQLVMFQTLVKTQWPDLFAHRSPAFSRGVVAQLFELFRQLPDHNLSADDLALPQFRQLTGFSLLPNLFKAFRHAIDQAGGDDITRLSQVASLSQISELAPQHVFWIGFAELPVIQRRCVRALMTQCASNTWHIAFSEDHPAGGLTRPLWDWLTPMVTDEHGPYEPRTPADTGGYFLTHFASTNQEIAALLRHIRYQLHIEKMPAANIGILIPKADPYTDLLTARAAEYGIPFTFKATELLRKRPLYGTLTAIIDLLTLPWHIDLILQFCHAPFFTVFQPETGPSIVVDGPALAQLNQRLVATDSITDWISHAKQALPLAPDPAVRDAWQRVIRLVSAIERWVVNIQGRYSPGQFGAVVGTLATVIGTPIEEGIQSAFQALAADTALMPTRWEDANATLKLVLDSIRLPAEHDTEGGVLITTPDASLGISRSLWWVCGFQEGNWPMATPEDFLIPQSIQRLIHPDRDFSSGVRYAIWSLHHHPQSRVILSVAPERAQTECVAAAIGDDLDIHLLQGPLPELGSDREIEGDGGTGVGQMAVSLVDPALIADLRQLFPSFSATVLDNLAECRHRFFLRSVLRLFPEMNREREIETIQWGNLIHEIISATLNTLIESNSHPSLPTLVKKIAQEKWATLHDHHPLWQLKKNQLFGTSEDPSFALTSLIASYLADVLDDWKPLHSEWSRAWQSSPDAPVITVQVDAIFQHRRLPFLAILDFKTGKSLPERAEIAAYTRLQLPIYAQAVQAAYPEFQLGPIGYLHLHSAAKSGFAIRLTTSVANSQKLTLGRSKPIEAEADYWAGLKAQIFTLTQSALHGEVGYPAPEDQPRICEYCPYIRMCAAPNRYGIQPL